MSNRSKNNKIGPVEKKYVFNECTNNYASGNLISSVMQNNNLNFLKEISKLSSINLSRINRKCSYSMLNSSHDSTESLLRGKEASDNENTPTRMVKSQSANVIANGERKKNFSTLTPATEKMPSSIIESGEFSISDSDKSTKPLLSRDPMSVPNFNEIPSHSSDSPYTPTERLLNFDLDENNEESNKCKSNLIKVFNKNNINNSTTKENGNAKIILPGTTFANENQAPNQKLKNSDSYHFNRKCQSDSYTSHLVSLGNEEDTECTTTGIPKSASVVRFKKQIAIADELTSDYCSIETVNKVSSSSNYSQSPGETNKELINDYPELKFGKSTDLSIKKSSTKNIGFGFSNPHYMGPDVQTILKTKDSQSYGKILNSPPDSLLEDTKKSISKNGCSNENVEMKTMTPNKSKQIEFKLLKQVRSPPRYLPLNGNPYNTTTVPISVDKKRKFRASSASRAERQEAYHSYMQHSINEEFSSINLESMTPLCVFLIGGKEHGQITVFKRPISLWKLRLSSNVY